jgi:hypothetical protein
MNRLRQNRCARRNSLMTRTGSRYPRDRRRHKQSRTRGELLPRASRARSLCSWSTAPAPSGRFTLPHADLRLARRFADDELVVRGAAGCGRPVRQASRAGRGDHALPTAHATSRRAQLWDRFQRTRSGWMPSRTSPRARSTSVLIKYPLRHEGPATYG